jgi:hypothetical protein
MHFDASCDHIPSLSNSCCQDPDGEGAELQADISSLFMPVLMNATGNQTNGSCTE